MGRERKVAVQKVTIKDVAREAGVSISTVSNALNNVDVLRPDTKQHILEVAQRLNYIPNLNGRNLKSKYTNVIGLFITSIRGAYYGILADAVYQSCKRYGYELNIFVGEKSETIMSNILGKRIDGAIILNEHIKEKEVEMLLGEQIPAVFIDRELQGEKVTGIVFDSYHAGETAAEYLIGLGHRSFAYMCGVDNNFDNTQRFRGFRDTLNQSGFGLREDYVLRGEFEKEAAYRSVKQFLKSGNPLPDALFAANDESAIGAIEAFLEEGIRVPQQVSVMGCDDIEIARLVKPSVTTIRTSFEKQGSLAVERLISLIREEESGSIIIIAESWFRSPR